MKTKPLSAPAETTRQRQARIRKNQLLALSPERIAAALAAQKLSTAAERPVQGWRST